MPPLPVLTHPPAKLYMRLGENGKPVALVPLTFTCLIRKGIGALNPILNEINGSCNAIFLFQSGLHNL